MPNSTKKFCRTVKRAILRQILAKNTQKQPKNSPKTAKINVWSLLDTVVSGSLVVQNGKLVGAVTHVFVDDPTKGSKIFKTTDKLVCGLNLWLNYRVDVTLIRIEEEKIASLVF